MTVCPAGVANHQLREQTNEAISKQARKILRKTSRIKSEEYPRAVFAYHIYCRKLGEGALDFVLPLLYSRMRTNACLALHAIYLFAGPE